MVTQGNTAPDFTLETDKGATVHAAFRVVLRKWQSFYHFTVGAPVEDGRLSTWPAYNFEEGR